MRQSSTITVALVVCALMLTAVAPVGAAPAGGTTQECTFPVSEVDATGTEVTVDEEPDRVVVLAPSGAQVLWDIGAKEKVVGMPVNQYTAYLEGSQDRENVVNDDGTVNKEQVISVEPDLVLAPNIIPNETVNQLRDANLTVYKAGFGRTLEDIYAKTELFGQLVGACDEAESTIEETKAEVQEIHKTVRDRERPGVLYYFFNYTAGNGTFIHQVIETAGGKNIAATAGVEGYREINPEIVADQDPEWVVIPSDAQFPEGEPYSSTTAYEQDQRLTVDTNLISQPGPRVVQPMRKMAEAFHPEAFEETPTPTPEKQTGTPTLTQTETADDGAGFGAAAVIGALLAVALLGARHSE